MTDQDAVLRKIHQTQMQASPDLVLEQFTRLSGKLAQRQRTSHGG